MATLFEGHLSGLRIETGMRCKRHFPLWARMRRIGPFGNMIRPIAPTLLRKRPLFGYDWLRYGPAPVPAVAA